MPNQHPAWNKGRLLGQKPPLKPKEIWSLRIRLQLAGKTRDLALFNLAIDSKLRGCDWFLFGFGTCIKEMWSPAAPSSCSARHSGQCSSGSRRRRANRSQLGWREGLSALLATCSLGDATKATCQCASTAGS
jgi:hypothetical protein